MTMFVTELATELKSQVPPSGSKPSTSDYELMVRNAIRDYGHRRPMVKETTLDIISGTASYTLPVDFWQLIWFEKPGTAQGVFISGSSIIPLPASGWAERFGIEGQTLVLYPTPEYSWESRRMRYKAIHVETDGGYSTLTEDDKTIFMLKAEALALTLLANTKAPDAIDYRQGFRGMSEDRGGAVAALRDQAKARTKEYEEALSQANLGASLRATYTREEIDTYNSVIV